MTNPQGTIWESEIVNAFKSLGLKADRHPKRGQPGEPDLWIGNPDATVGVLAWKRLVGKKGDGPRKPDGERRVVVMEFDDFRQLVKAFNELADKAGLTRSISFQVQAKWTTNLNVTKTLGLLRSWLKRTPQLVVIPDPGEYEKQLAGYDC